MNSFFFFLFQMPGGILQKNFKKIKSRTDIAKTLWAFFGENLAISNQFLWRLCQFRQAAEESAFFREYEVYSSLRSVIFTHFLWILYVIVKFNE